jgi:hypothetical protein
MSDSDDTDFLEAEVQSGVAPLRDMGLSPAVIAEAENLLRMALADHPTGRYLMQRAKPRVVKQSGATAVGDKDGEGSAAQVKVRGSR